MNMTLDETTKARLHTMMWDALAKAEKAMEEHDYHEADELIDIARSCDHICRKHWEMEHCTEQHA